MDIKLGTFHEVTGVAVGENGVSILNRAGVEQLIPLKAHRDQLRVRGEFGDFSNITGGEYLRGIEPRDITEIEVEIDFEDSNYHTKILRLKNKLGLNLTWELYCNGNPTET